MRATTYPSHQSYYSSPYQFYYTTTGRYCAYDAKSGTHLIHSLTDNRWYQYFPGIIPPSQQYPHQQPHPYNRANDFQYQHYQHQSHGPHRTGGVRSTYPDSDQYKSRERNRDPVNRSHREEFLYSAADVEAAERSLIEETNIDRDVYFEDEGVDVRMGDKAGRHWRPSNERQRQRSRSGPERRNEEDAHRSSPYSQEASRARTTPGPQNNHTVNHTCQRQQTPGRVYSKHTQGQHFGSNQAGVGYEASEHDSGYMDDFDPVPPHRRNMPGVARWLDNTPSEFSVDGGYHPFDVENDGMRHASESNPRSAHTHKAGRVVIDPLLNKPHHDNYRTIASYHTEARSTQKQQNAQSRMSPRKEDRHRSSATKMLHRQDSGIDMSDAMAGEVDIEIDIHMEGTSEVEGGGIYPSLGCFPRGSPHPAYASPHRSTHPSSSRKTKEEFDCYYRIPPCPNLPPLEEPTVGTVEMIYLSGGQELTAPHYLRNPPVSPTFRQPDSVYTASVAANPRPKYHPSPAMLPRAPSPPLSPSPDYTQRTRRSGLGVPVVDYDRRYTRPRW